MNGNPSLTAVGFSTDADGAQRVYPEASLCVHPYPDRADSAVRLNRARIYEFRSWSGWYHGRERIPAQLQPGTNRIVIEPVGSFLISVTDHDDC
jgi:hypothetical protein